MEIGTLVSKDFKCWVMWLAKIFKVKIPVTEEFGGCQTWRTLSSLWGVGVDVVEDVDEDEEESDEERHAARYDVGGDEEADPGHEHEQARGEVVGDDVGHHVPRQLL